MCEARQTERNFLKRITGEKEFGESVRNIFGLYPKRNIIRKGKKFQNATVENFCGGYSEPHG
jgi:hypothetical protein